MMRGKGGAHKTFLGKIDASLSNRLPSLQPSLVQCDQLRMAFSPLASPIPPTARLLFPRRRRENLDFPLSIFLPLPLPSPRKFMGKEVVKEGRGGGDLFPPLSSPSPSVVEWCFWLSGGEENAPAKLTCLSGARTAAHSKGLFEGKVLRDFFPPAFGLCEFILKGLFWKSDCSGGGV